MMASMTPQDVTGPAGGDRDGRTGSTVNADTLRRRNAQTCRSQARAVHEGDLSRVRRAAVRSRMSGGEFHARTTRLGLARALWFHGEDDLWARARQLPLPTMLDIGERAGQLYQVTSGVWLGRRMTGAIALVLAGIEHFEGRVRKPQRLRRRPEKNMPRELVATEEERWADPEWQELDRLFWGRESEKRSGWSLRRWRQFWRRVKGPGRRA
jgi:hypothetical protein